MSVLTSPASFTSAAPTVVRDPPDATVEAIRSTMNDVAIRDRVMLPRGFIRQAAEKAANVLREHPDSHVFLLHHYLHAAMVSLLTEADLDTATTEKFAVSLAWAAKPYV